MNNSFDNFDGVIEYEATLGMSPIKNNPLDEDNFYPMDGGGCRCGCCPKCERKSNALGGLIPSKAELKKNRARRQARKDVRVNTKMTQAQAGKIASESLGKETATDIALAQALASSPTTETKGSMSKNTKTAIIVGSVILVGVLGYFGYKKFSNK
jgi:hypothetical protein